MPTDAKTILKQTHLSVTDSRLKILLLFLKEKKALSHADIEKSTGDLFDRVTIYRTLQTFVENGIIHLIPTTDNTVKYALCREDCVKGHHHDHHVHFICDVCNRTFCLENVPLPEISLPKGFRGDHMEVIVSGQCQQCGGTI